MDKYIYGNNGYRYYFESLFEGLHIPKGTNNRRFMRPLCIEQ